VDQAIAPGVDGLHRRLEQCQQLVAAYYEMLRLNTASASIRGIAKDTTLGNSVLRAGNKAMVPYRQLHMSREAWGANAAEFDPTRFLDAKSKTRSSSFRPFGGGTTYCAGTYIAMREILCVVALVLHRFELSLPEDATRSSQYVVDMVDDAMPSLGVLPPKPGRDVEVLVKKATS
jgi:cytochrome P450